MGPTLTANPVRAPANRRRHASSVASRAPPGSITSLASTSSPGRHLGSSPPAMPMLISAVAPRLSRSWARASARAALAPAVAIHWLAGRSKADDRRRIVRSTVRPTTAARRLTAARSHPVRDAPDVVLGEVAVTRQRPQREIMRVAEIAQIEHAREADGGVPVLLPPLAVAGIPDEVGDAALDLGAVDLSSRHQAEQRPRRLRWRARLALAAPVRPIRGTILAPAVVGVLAPDQIVDRPAHRGRCRINPCDVQRAQHRPRPINVIGAPTPEPRSVWLLLLEEVGQTALGRLASARSLELRQHDDAARTHVCGGRVEQRAVVGERNMVEDVMRVLGVEGAPAAVPRLHPDEP